MTNTYSRATTTQRTRFRNKFLKNPTEEKINKETSVSLLRKEKREYSVKINENNIIDNRKFGQTVKPFLSDKFKSKEPFILVNNDDIIKLK